MQRAEAARLNRKQSKNWLITYSVIFLAVSFVVFSFTYLQNRTLILGDDGLKQHYRALMYYGEYLRSIIGNLLQGNGLVIPQWDFSIGEGSDILETLHYYVIGDPFTFLSVFVPARFTWLLYDFLMIARLYCAGLSFFFFCRYLGKSSFAGMMAGSLTYAFCYWGLYSAVTHPFFANSMIWFPLILLGTEKILRKERPYALILSVMIAALSNFYFFYVQALLTVLYVMIRLLSCYRGKWKEAGIGLLRIAGASILGVLMAGVILFPMLYAFLGSDRMASGIQIHWLYPASHYLKLAGLFLEPTYSYEACLGYSAAALPAILLLFSHKGNRVLKLCLAACLVFLLIPAFGQAFNGFSYMCNRWTWALSLAVSCAVSVEWDLLLGLTKKKTILLLAGLAVYLIVLILCREYTQEIAYIQLGLCALLAATNFLPGAGGRYTRLIPFALVIIGIFVTAAGKYSIENWAQECLTVEEAEAYADNETKAVQTVKEAAQETGLVRYSGLVTTNAGLQSGLSSTQFYWTISPPAFSKYRADTDQCDGHNYSFWGYNNRAAQLALSLSKYYVAVPSASEIPYGYVYTGTYGDYNVFYNQNSLPFGYSVSRVIPYTEWKALPSVERQEALLQGVVLEDEFAAGTASLEFTSQEISYELKSGQNARLIDEHTIEAEQGNASVRLTFKGAENSETYIVITGLKYSGEAP